MYIYRAQASAITFKLDEFACDLNVRGRKEGERSGDGCEEVLNRCFQAL